MSARGGRLQVVSIFEILEPRLLLCADISAFGGEIVENSADHAHVAYFDPAPDLSRLNSQASSASEPAAAAPFPLDQTFLLHSNPGASKVIYIDFDGHTTSGTEWNTSFNGGAAFTSPAYSFQGDSSFTDTEKERIQGIWERVVEDYIPFDVDVTTEDPGSAALLRSGVLDTEWGVRVVVGGDSADWYTPNAGGVAYVGSYTWNSDTPAYVFPENLANNEKYVAEAISHEAGHTLGLYHDGTNSVEYYDGHGSGATGWAPIMGVGYYEELVQWSKGEYPSANNSEDDLAIIVGGNGFGYQADDHGDTLQAADILAFDGAGVVFDEGVIGRNTDVDFFSFESTAGAISLNIDPFVNSPNLDILASLYDSSGALIASDNPSTALNAGFNLILSPGTYYLGVEGVGKQPLDTGYSDYGSLGYYSISGDVGGPDVTDVGVVDADIDFDTEFPDDSDTVMISATIRNLGNTDVTDVGVRFYDGDPSGGGVQIGGDSEIASMIGFASSVVQVDWAPDVDGQYDIYVVVDPDGTIVEEFEDNNTAFKPITVVDNDTDGPDIYNVAVTEHNGDGDGIIAADEQILISWELTDSIARGLLVTEVSTGKVNSVEIQNVWDQPVDAAGWVVLFNDSAPASDINAVNPQAWSLDGVVAGGQVLYRTEDPAGGAGYLGGGIQWENDGPGWVMIVDGSGAIKDFAVWGYASAQIDAMSIDYGSFTGLAPGSHWSGDGAEKGAEAVPPPPPVVGAITYTGGTYAEDFDSMGSGGTATPDGWVAGKYTVDQDHQPPGSAPLDETLTVDDGSSRRGNSYNYGTTGASDRAVGSMSDRKADRAIQLAVTNDTGAKITALTLAYTGEQWRDSKTNASLPQLLSVWFSTDPGSGFVSMGDEFSFLAPSNSGLNSKIDGNDPSNRTEISGVYTLEAPVLDGETFYITWNDQNADRGDHGMAIDDVILIPEFTPPNVILERIGYADNNTAVDFVRNNESTIGAENPGLVASSGIGPVELLIGGAPVTLAGDYYAVAGPLDSDGLSALEHSFTINAGDGDNSPSYAQLVGSVIVSPSEEITVIYESQPLVSGEITPIDFGQVGLDAPVVEKMFEIRNDGAQKLILGEITAPEGFSVTPPPVADIAPGGSTSFSVTLDTDTVGTFSGDIVLVSSDGSQSPDGLDETQFTIAITAMVNSQASIVGRYVFYNNSAWDAGGDDNAAIAVDKAPLLGGQAVGPANYTNYSLGINGVMVDIDNPAGTPTAGDFAFMVNLADQPNTWSPAPEPTVAVESGGGIASSDRVTLVWPDGAIVNQWLQVTVLSGGATGLDAPDVFYIGNAAGDTDGDGQVGASDYDSLASEFGLSGGPGALAADVNASGRVDLADFSIIRRAFGDIVLAPTPPLPAAPALSVDLLAAPVGLRSGDHAQVDVQTDAEPMPTVSTGSVVRTSDASNSSPALLLTVPIGQIAGALDVSNSSAEPWSRVAIAPEELRALSGDTPADRPTELTADLLVESTLLPPWPY